MNYTYEQFIEDVKAEAKALREHATPEELAKLDIQQLVPEDYDQCLYGLMTGDCTSDRAHDLIRGCCIRYFKPYQNGNISFRNVTFERIRNVADGTTAPADLAEERIEHLEYMSAIEMYILLPTARNAALVAYLRGETNELILV